MRESFIFYKSFYDAIELLGEKAQLKLYKSIMKLNFNCCESETELEQLCDEIETELKQNRSVFAQFLLIKPQILANNKRFLNGLKGKSSGHLGGAPKGNKNASKNNPKTTPNENVNVNVNENVNVNVVRGCEKEKRKDPYSNNEVVSLFQKSYQENFNCCAYLTAQQKNKIIELNSEIPDFKATIPVALRRLKEIKFEALPNYTPTANWLLKDDNYTAVMNGTFEAKKTIWDKLREQENEQN